MNGVHGAAFFVQSLMACLLLVVTYVHTQHSMALGMGKVPWAEGVLVNQRDKTQAGFKQQT